MVICDGGGRLDNLGAGVQSVEVKVVRSEGEEQRLVSHVAVTEHVWSLHEQTVDVVRI